MTNHWVDIKNANVVVVMGGNAAEAHPVGFRWAMEAKNNNDATLIVVDPRLRARRRWPISMRRFVPAPTLPSCRRAAVPDRK
jgi:predicted molibdopterin-dependent oxidoreductase YjgC